MGGSPDGAFRGAAQQFGGYPGQTAEFSDQPNDLFGGYQPQPGFGAGIGSPAGPGQFGPPSPSAGRPAEGKPRWWRSKLVLIGGTVALVVIVLGAVYVVTRPHSISSDPGCQAYSSTALPAYNNAVKVLNSQASEAKVSGETSTAVTDLTSAAQQAKSASVRSALGTMLTQLKTVQAGVAAGSVPSSVVKALNAASAAADAVCS